MSDEDRAQARQNWARAALADQQAQLERASVDAGFRSYWRSHGLNGSRIVMDSPPDKEDVQPWLRMRSLLECGGVRVPRVLAQDVDAGFVLLEDLGAETYLQVINDENADKLFDDAIGQLLTLQGIPCPPDLATYDEHLLLRELRLFDTWFLERELGLTLEGGTLAALEHVYRLLVDAAGAQPRVLVHRDFMPRNLMPAGNGPAVLDFQDAVHGPIAYDPLSLFKDAFVSWPERRVQAWLERYHARARAAGLPVPGLAQFLRDADWIGMQRHLKVLGIFARLKHRDAKPKYIADAPRFLAYLDSVLPRYPELAALADVLDRLVRPALQQRLGA